METLYQNPDLFNIKNTELRNITESVLKLISTEKIICYGSKIHTLKVESCFRIGEEQSKLLNSYYLLVVPDEDEKRPGTVIQQLIEEHCKGTANTTVIVHRMDEINEALQNGSSFFTAVYRRGILLYDKEQVPFAEPGKGDNIPVRITKREKFWNKWNNLAANFLKGAAFYASQHINSLAIFMLHQSLQHCYSGMLRVVSGYRSNSNSLPRLMLLIESMYPRSFNALSKNTPEEARLTALLMKGFSDARYKDTFEASDEEVTLLIEKVTKILELADSACRQRLNELREKQVPFPA